MGRGKPFWIGFAVVLAVALVYPAVADPYDVGNFAYFFIWLFMALGLCLMWGYGGVLSFRPALFFCFAGVRRCGIAINLCGNRFSPLLAAARRGVVVWRGAASPLLFCCFV